jgi:hypothetical protein
VIVGTEIVVDPAVGGDPAEVYALHVRAVGSGQEQLAKVSIGFDACVASGASGHAWTFLVSATTANTHAIELWLVNRKSKRRVVFSETAAELPDGARLGNEGRSVFLTPP